MSLLDGLIPEHKPAAKPASRKIGHGNSDDIPLSVAVAQTCCGNFIELPNPDSGLSPKADLVKRLIDLEKSYAENTRQLESLIHEHYEGTDRLAPMLNAIRRTK